MATIRTTYKYKCDLDKGTLETSLRNSLMQADALADAFAVTVQRNGSDVDISGMTVYGYLYASATKTTVPLKGTVSGSTATVILSEDCYAVPGYASLMIQLHDGDVRHTVLKVDFVVTRTGGTLVLDGDNILPTLAELLGQISAMEQATADAREATAVANQAVENVEAFKDEIQGDITALTEEVGSLKETIGTYNRELRFVNGRINETNGVVYYDMPEITAVRLITPMLFEAEKHEKITATPGYKYKIIFYDDDSGAYSGSKTEFLTDAYTFDRDCWCRFIVGKTDATTITPGDAGNIRFETTAKQAIIESKNALGDGINIRKIDFVQGHLNAEDGNVYPNIAGYSEYRVTTPEIVDVRAGDTFVIGDDFVYYMMRFDDDGNVLNKNQAISGRGGHAFNQDDRVRICIRRIEQVEITPETDTGFVYHAINKNVSTFMRETEAFMQETNKNFGDGINILKIDFVQGHLNTTNGKVYPNLPGYSEIRIATPDIIDAYAGDTFMLSDAYVYYMMFFDEDGNVTNENNPVSGNGEYVFDQDARVRICIKRTDSAALTPDEDTGFVYRAVNRSVSTFMRETEETAENHENRISTLESYKYPPYPVWGHEYMRSWYEKLYNGENVKVICVGDSTTQSSNKHEMVKKILTLGGYDVAKITALNMGLGMQHTASWIGYHDLDDEYEVEIPEYGFLHQHMAENPDFMLVGYGFNDGSLWHFPGLTLEERADGFRERLREALGRIRTNGTFASGPSYNKNADELAIIIATPVSRNTADGGDLTADKWCALIRPIIQEACRDFACAYADFTGREYDHDFSLRWSMNNDGTHPTYLVHTEMMSMLGDIIYPLCFHTR